MDYITVKDMRKTRELWRLLDREKELVVTRDGLPCAVLVGVRPERVEESVHEIRRGLFSVAVRKARQAAKDSPLSRDDVQREIDASRTAMGLR